METTIVSPTELAAVSSSFFSFAGKDPIYAVIMLLIVAALAAFFVWVRWGQRTGGKLDAMAAKLEAHDASDTMLRTEIAAIKEDVADLKTDLKALSEKFDLAVTFLKGK